MDKNNDYHIRTFYNQIAQKHPMLLEHQFVIEFIEDDNTPVKLTTGKMDDIAYFAQSATIPKYSISVAKMVYYGTEFRQPGVKTYDHNWSCDILIDRDLTIYNKLKAWREQISSLKLSGGGVKTIPNVKLRVSILDSTMQTKQTSFILEGVWPSKMPSLELGYENGDATPMKVGIEFKYQYAYEDENITTELKTNYLDVGYKPNVK
jgi:hypothetical protein